MNVDSILKALLDKLGVPVERLKYQIHIYSKTDYFAILQQMKAALKAADFYGWTIDAETFEQDTGYYHITVQIKYMEV